MREKRPFLGAAVLDADVDVDVDDVDDVDPPGVCGCEGVVVLPSVVAVSRGPEDCVDEDDPSHSASFFSMICFFSSGSFSALDDDGDEDDDDDEAPPSSSIPFFLALFLSSASRSSVGGSMKPTVCSDGEGDFVDREPLIAACGEDARRLPVTEAAICAGVPRGEAGSAEAVALLPGACKREVGGDETRLFGFELFRASGNNDSSSGLKSEDVSPFVSLKGLGGEDKDEDEDEDEDEDASAALLLGSTKVLGGGCGRCCCCCCCCCGCGPFLLASINGGTATAGRGGLWTWTW